MQQHRHPVAGADATGGERAGDARRSVVELGVRALDAVEHERHALRARVPAQVLSTVHALTPGAP